MRIAIATFASLPLPPVKGGAVEALIDDLCKVNETEKRLSIDVFSIQNPEAVQAAASYTKTKFIYYEGHSNKRFSRKNLVRKLFGVYIPDRTMSELVDRINNNKYDFVIVTSINYEMEAIFRKIHSKVIWYLHGDPLSVLSKEAIRRITEQCRAVMTVSNFVKRRVRSAAPDCEVLTVRNCTDIVPLSSGRAREVRCAIRKKLGISENEILFIYVGRITPIKGIMELVQAFVTIDQKNAKLLIVGAPSNDSEEHYFKIIQSIANNRVLFWGYASHSSLNELYCASDCVVAPSTCQEAAPLVALEASVCNRPLIATNIGGIPEYAENSELLVEYDECFENHLMEAIKTMCSDYSYEKHTPMQVDGVKQYYTDFCSALQRLS